MKTKYNFKDMVGKALRWIASLFLIIVLAIGLSNGSFVSAICLLIVLLLVLPIRIDFLEEIKSRVHIRKSIQIILVVIFLIAGTLTMKTIETSNTTTNVSTSMKSSIRKETAVPTATPTPSPTSTSVALEAAAIVAGSTINANTATETPKQEVTKFSYIVNKNTKKFHRTNCSSTKKMKSSNRWDYEGTRGELINMGYEPCKKCNP